MASLHITRGGHHPHRLPRSAAGQAAPCRRYVRLEYHAPQRFRERCHRREESADGRPAASGPMRVFGAGHPSGRLLWPFHRLLHIIGRTT
jgi:hypothetical protein